MAFPDEPMRVPASAMPANIGISGVGVADSGPLAVGGQSGNIAAAHGLGFAPSNAVVVGHLVDGFFAHQLQWRVAGVDGTNVTVVFANLGPNANARALLNFRVIYG
jgi:hypothetical protein